MWIRSLTFPQWLCSVFPVGSSLGRANGSFLGQQFDCNAHWWGWEIPFVPVCSLSCSSFPTMWKSVETFCCWTLSCSFFLSPVLPVLLAANGKPLWQGWVGISQFHSAPSPFHWTPPLFSTVLLANKMMNPVTKQWKLLAPWTILLFPHSSNFNKLLYHHSSLKIGYCNSRTDDHGNLQVHLLQ